MLPLHHCINGAGTAGSPTAHPGSEGPVSQLERKTVFTVAGDAGAKQLWVVAVTTSDFMLSRKSSVADDHNFQDGILCSLRRAS